MTTLSQHLRGQTNRIFGIQHFLLNRVTVSFLNRMVDTTWWNFRYTLEKPNKLLRSYIFYRCSVHVSLFSSDRSYVYAGSRILDSSDSSFLSFRKVLITSFTIFTWSYDFNLFKFDCSGSFNFAPDLLHTQIQTN